MATSEPRKMPEGPLIVANELSRRYVKGKHEVVVFDHLNFSIAEGEFVAIVGPSGSGKSTVLNLVAGFDRPTSGTLVVGNDLISSLPDAAICDWRARHVGFVFQSHNLVSLLTAIENVEFPLRRISMPSSERRTRAKRALALVGLADRGAHFPNELSGGEEQRVAIARAIVTDPKILIADEPTGNLDAKSAKHVMEILKTLNQQHSKTIILVTHDMQAAGYAGRRLSLDKGVLAAEGEQLSEEPV